MSLIARHLEENGIATVTLSNARDITECARNPRTVFTNYPLGNPAGRPQDPENQRNILGAALKLLEEAEAPGIIVDTPHEWRADRDWMRLIFSEEQEFLSDEAESRRQAGLTRAREQKRSAANPAC